VIIYKYELKILGFQVLEMPEGSQVLSVGNQRGKVCLWAMVDPAAPVSLRAFEVFGTGNPMPDDEILGRKFIGTVIVDPFVWHVFEPSRKPVDPATKCRHGNDEDTCERCLHAWQAKWGGA